MDMTKSTGYRAVEELLKAQATHMALKKQFEEARVTEMTLAQREVVGQELSIHLYILYIILYICMIYASSNLGI